MSVAFDIAALRSHSPLLDLRSRWQSTSTTKYFALLELYLYCGALSSVIVEIIVEHVDVVGNCRLPLFELSIK